MNGTAPSPGGKTTAATSSSTAGSVANTATATRQRRAQEEGRDPGQGSQGATTEPVARPTVIAAPGA